MAEQMYLLQVSWPGGAYAPGLKTLAPGETLALDLRHLRDAQVPDRLGRTIPIDVAGGQVHWSAKSRERHAIIGRAETVDPEHAVSSTYACVNCCPDNPYDSWTAPGSLALGTGITDVLVAWLRDIDCYDTILEAYDLGPGQLQWSSSNTNVATVSWGEVTGVGEGTANIYGTYSTSWWWEQNTDCESASMIASRVKTQPRH
ncbi:MAG: Ig-like domain-containing protein [Vicinamibacterales bacterium]